MTVGAGAAGHREQRNDIFHETELGNFAGCGYRERDGASSFFASNRQSRLSVSYGRHHAGLGNRRDGGVRDAERTPAGDVALTGVHQHYLRGLRTLQVNRRGIDGDVSRQGGVGKGQEEEDLKVASGEWIYRMR